MIEPRSFTKVVFISASIAAIITNFLSWVLLAEAKDNTKNTSLQSVVLEWSNQNNPDFSQDGRPKRSAGGASRNGCQAQASLPLTALIPETTVAKTLIAAPTFWFYVPHALTPKHTIEFVLKNERDDYVYQTKFVKEISPGIVSLPLPPSVNLKVNQNYDWYFLIHCAPQNNKRFAYVNGTIRRVKPNLPNKLKTTTPEERLFFYATEKLWYDALTNLAQRAIAKPQDKALQNDWVTLLQSVDLGKLTDKPFVPCCSVKE